jgi:hypothetical protein
VVLYFLVGSLHLLLFEREKEGGEEDDDEQKRIIQQTNTLKNNVYNKYELDEKFIKCMFIPFISFFVNSKLDWIQKKIQPNKTNKK